jgi:glycine/D-amino acid oxidase-like deaminating enzyme
MQPAALVIGGGFFGCSIALHLRQRGFSVSVIEREDRPLARASYANQARVHNGYHYPRSYVTAARSRANMARFAREFAPAMKRDFSAIYALAARRSKVMPTQYERFMRDIGASFEHAGSAYARLFDRRMVAAVYVAEECAFDAARLRELLTAQLQSAGVELWLGAEAVSVVPRDAGVQVEVRTSSGTRTLSTGLAVNCTYARTNWNMRASASASDLKHELTEVALIDVPEPLRNVGITVMDGPFFSCMPFPAEQCHSLTHVRYTPHREQSDVGGHDAVDPLLLLKSTPLQSRVRFMLADAARFVPLLRTAAHRRSLFEVKTVLAQREVDDGRPILLRRDFAHPGVLSVLGGKLDNVYDVLTELDRLLDVAAASTAIEAA